MLDATSARGLAETMDALNGRSASKRRHMLLYCFSKLNRGKPPTFKVGTRTLAKACGVTRRAAMLFFEFMDAEGYFVVTEEGEEGRYDSRTFWWFVETGTYERTGTFERTGVVRKPRAQRTGEGYVNHGSYVPHQSAEHSYNGSCSATPSPPQAPPAGAGAPGGVRDDPYDYGPPPAPPYFGGDE